MSGLTKKKFKKICEMHIRMETAYCCLCGKPIYRIKDYNIEHLTPRSRGGKDDISNWQICHKTCNAKKGALTLEEYKQWLLLEAKRNGHVK